MIIVLLIFLLVSAPAWAIEEFATMTLHDGAIANGNGSVAPVTHYGTAGISVEITNTATVTFQGRSVGGQAYGEIRCINTATGAVGTSAQASGNYQCPVAGLMEIRVPISGCASCIVSVKSRLTTATISGLASLTVEAAGADGAVLDGVTSSIRATVKDYTNSNPLAVVTVDANGDLASSGGGTQYNQGTVATDTDTMTMAGATRRDTAAVATGVLDGDRVGLSTDAVGRLRVNGSDTTQPVSGTVTVTDGSGPLTVDGTVSAAQSGTWDINALTSITNPVAVTGTFWQATQPISAASLPLPSGAATAANQDGIVKDGTGDTTQANVSSGRLHVDGSGVTQPVSGTVTANAGTGTFFDGILRDGTGDTTQANVSSGNLHVNCTNCSGSGASHIDNAAFTGGSDDVAPMGALYDTTPPTITDGSVGAPRMNSSRILMVDGSGATQPVSGTVTVTDGAGDLTVDGTVAATQSGTWNISNISGTVSLPTGAATAALQDGIIKDGAGDTTQANVSSGRLHVDGSGVTQPVSGTVTANAGSGTFFDGILKDGTGDTTQANVISGSLSVNCTNCSGSGASHIDNAAFTGGSDDVAPMGALYDTTPPAITDGNLGAPRMDSNRYLYTNCVVGCSGGATTPTDNFANPTDAGNSAAFNFVWDGATWDRAPGNSADGLLVNLGTNNDVTVTSGTVAATQSGTWNIGSITTLPALPAGSNNIGDVDIVTINGQAPAFGTGARSAATQRVTIATDDVVPAAQSGTWNITNVSGTVSLPTGAATLAEQQTQTTALQLIDNLPLTQSSATSGQSGVLTQGAVTTSAPTYTTGNTNPISLQTDGSQRVAVTNTPAVSQSGTWNIGTVTTLPALPANQSVNIAQMNGVTTTMGNGVSGTGVQRVTIASDSTGTVAATQATASSLNMRPDTSGATGAAPPARANYVGGLASGATGGLVSGFAVCDSFVNVNVSTATTTALVTGVSGRHVRICGINLVTAAANNVALISGTGATCGTGTTGMNGGTTAASGWNFAANSGLAQGSGLGVINQTNATGDSVCIVTSATTQLSGRIAYAIY